MNEPEVAPPKVVGTGEVGMARAQPKLLPELVSRLKGVLERFTTGSVPISKTIGIVVVAAFAVSAAER